MAPTEKAIGFLPFYVNIVSIIFHESIFLYVISDFFFRAMWRFGWQACCYRSVNRRVDYQRLETSRLLESRTCGWRGCRPSRANGPGSHRSKHQRTRWAVLWFSGLLKNTKGLPLILCILWKSSGHGGCLLCSFHKDRRICPRFSSFTFCGIFT